MLTFFDHRFLLVDNLLHALASFGPHSRPDRRMVCFKMHELKLFNSRIGMTFDDVVQLAVKRDLVYVEDLKFYDRTEQLVLLKWEVVA
jgi:hypothetical protein